ncbi:MAG: hypothetical protein ACHQZR_03665 [Candidatus Limnocylindrales bacterium]
MEVAVEVAQELVQVNTSAASTGGGSRPLTPGASAGASTALAAWPSVAADSSRTMATDSVAHAAQSRATKKTVSRRARTRMRSRR